LNFYCLTLFPEMIDHAVSCSILGRAISEEKIGVETINIRDFAHNKHGHVDDTPFGGGAGMVMQPGPIYEAWEHVMEKIDETQRKQVPVIYLSPKGRTLNQSIVRELAEYENMILLCGHYEGVDQRVLDEIVTDEISVGDYVLTGGELGALIIMDAVSRYVPGVLGNETSTEDESFSGMYLEYPQYTRPREFHGMEVPEVLLNGNHEAIRKWRLERSMEITLQRRPEMINTENMTKEEKKIFTKLVTVQR